MRLTQYEISSIKKAFYETFKDGKIFLFGSRVETGHVIISKDSRRLIEKEAIKSGIEL